MAVLGREGGFKILTPTQFSGEDPGYTANSDAFLNPLFLPLK
jgi:hypothetical protein